MDLFNELGSAFPYFLTLVVIASFCVGVDFYINEMVTDLQATLKQLDVNDVENIWSTYVNEIRFHAEIIKYDSKLFYVPD